MYLRVSAFSMGTFFFERVILLFFIAIFHEIRFFCFLMLRQIFFSFSKVNLVNFEVQERFNPTSRLCWLIFSLNCDKVVGLILIFLEGGLQI